MILENKALKEMIIELYDDGDDYHKIVRMLDIIDKEKFGINEDLARKHTEAELEMEESDDEYFCRYFRDKLYALAKVQRKKESSKELARDEESEELSSLNVTREFNELKHEYQDQKGPERNQVETLKVVQTKKPVPRGVLKKGQVLKSEKFQSQPVSPNPHPKDSGYKVDVNSLAEMMFVKKSTRLSRKEYSREQPEDFKLNNQLAQSFRDKICFRGGDAINTLRQ